MDSGTERTIPQLNIGDALEVYKAHEAHLDAVWSAPRNSWAWRDIDHILEGDTEEPPPVYLARSDGVKLLYAGKTHDAHGPPESAKGWFACIGVADVLSGGSEHVVYIDFEDSDKGVVSRLMAMGVDVDALRERFHYVGPEAPTDKLVLEQSLVRSMAPVGLVVLDGVHQAMSNDGLDTNSNKDTNNWYQEVPKWIARQGPAVLMIDHTVKSGNETRHASGAGQKLAAVDGASFLAEVVQPFGKGGVKGEMKISVCKDRPGWLRQSAKGKGLVQHIATLHLESFEDGKRVEWRLDKPADGIGGVLARAVRQQVRVWEYIRDNEGCNLTTLQSNCGVGHDSFPDVLRTLVDHGNIRQEQHGRAVKHFVVKTLSQYSGD